MRKPHSCWDFRVIAFLEQTDRSMAKIPASEVEQTQAAVPVCSKTLWADSILAPTKMSAPLFIGGVVFWQWETIEDQLFLFQAMGQGGCCHT
mmetsp:Transcript_17085/g.46966  ORF Transcript_17085/g.46966 Transcript_17085/m.46966 type:complete len:92 (-) Transcript_17085:116-391(-)